MLESQPIASPPLSIIENPLRAGGDALVVGIDSSGALAGSLVAKDPERCGAISRLLERSGSKGKCGELTLLVAPWDEGPRLIVAAGIGAATDANRRLAFETAAAALRRLIDRQRESVHVSLAESFSSELHDAIVAGAVAGCEGQAIYKTDPIAFVPQVIAFSGLSDSAMRRGGTIADSINLAKRLVNQPASVIYPASFASEAAVVAEDAGLTIEIWDPERLKREGCRAILAVGAGSSQSPRLVILRHHGGASGEPPLALIGKGVTFDSGGLSIKPGDSMTDMKCDMAGAATVLATMQAIAKLGIRRNVIGLCGLTENMISGASYKLGDVIETRNGKTIEILNTDAEGRVVLADVLDVAVQYQPSAMVDVATLTGACMVALGTEVAGLMSNHQPLCDQLRQAADVEGEPVWQLPMFSLYDEKIKGKVADIKNVGEGRWGGAITAAKFLEQFVGDLPWVHIDVAGPAFADSPKPHRDAGATGVMVRTLIRWVETAPPIGST